VPATDEDAQHLGADDAQDRAVHRRHPVCSAGTSA
jgi:hypothetical protein